MVVPDVISLPVELEIFDLSLAAFATAAGMAGSVYGGPKWTVSPVYEGLLKEEMDAAAARHPEVQYFPTLIDATYAGLVAGARDGALVIPALNRDGDCFGLRWPARPSDRRSCGDSNSPRRDQHSRGRDSHRRPWRRRYDKRGRRRSDHSRARTASLGS